MIKNIKEGIVPKEQIIEESNKRYPIQHPLEGLAKESFRRGAEYGYNLALEKAVEWLCANITDTAYLGANTMMTLYKADLINNLKQAMKL